MSPAQVNLARAVVRRVEAATLPPVVAYAIRRFSTWTASATRSGAMSLVTRQDRGPWSVQGDAAMLSGFLTYRPDREGD